MSIHLTDRVKQGNALGMTDRAEIRSSLAQKQGLIADSSRERDALIAAGDKAGIPKTELAHITGLSRQAIYDILARETARTKASDSEAINATAALWTLGQVVEDRWGLRWRADIPMNAKDKAWQCRSVGLKVWRSHEKMAERGPLRAIRIDRIAGGSAGLQAEAEVDAAITVDGDQAEDSANGSGECRREG